MDELYYRYEESQLDWEPFRAPSVWLLVFRVVKRTPAGAWIALTSWSGYFNVEGHKRFVLDTARKRYACPTKEEAQVSFLARKRRQVKILEAQLNRARLALNTNFDTALEY